MQSLQSKLLAMAGAVTIMLIALCLPAYAAGFDEITGNMVLEISEQTNLYEEASEESSVVTSLEVGTVVITTENAEAGWCKISAGEHTGYIKVECLKTIGDKDLINQEFEQNMNENHVIYDEIQQLEEQKSQAEIWRKIMPGLAIIVLVVGGIFVWKKNKASHTP